MSQLRIIGIVLIVLGVLSFSYEGLIKFKTREKVIDAGPVQVTAERTHTIRFPVVGGAAALIGGVVLLVVAAKKP